MAAQLFGGRVAQCSHGLSRIERLQFVARRAPKCCSGNLCGPRGTRCDKPRASRFPRDLHFLASAGPDDGSQANGTVDRAHDRIE